MHTYQSIKNIYETSKQRTPRRKMAKVILNWMEKNRKVENKLHGLDKLNDDKAIEWPSKQRPRGNVIMSFSKNRISAYRHITKTLSAVLP